MTKIQSPEEWLDDNIPDWHGVFYFGCMSSYGKYVRDATLDEAAEKAKICFDEDGYELGIDKLSILSLKTSKNLEI
jgi:hypothetical protein